MVQSDEETIFNDLENTIEGEEGQLMGLDMLERRVNRDSRILISYN